MNFLPFTIARPSAPRARGNLRVVRAFRCPWPLVLGLTLLAGCDGSGGSSRDKGAEYGDTSGAIAPEGTENATHASEVVELDTAGVRLAGIRTDTVRTTSTSGLSVTGMITFDADRVSHVGARTEGRVVSMHAALGAPVRAGQTLAVLESPTVGQIRAQEREAEELREIARENFAREQRLASQGISSRKELLDAEAELRRTEAALRSAEAQLAAFGAGHGTGGQFTLTAPFGGVVVAREVSRGEMASPADTLFTIADLSRVWIELSVFERDLARVRVGQSVAVAVAAYPGREFPGRIVYLGHVLDAARRTVQARVEVPNRDGALKPGMFATASIQVGAERSRTIVVPEEAVQDVEGKTVVFAPGEKPGEFRTMPIELGEPVGNGFVTVRAGLSPGTRIVVAGAFALRSELAKSEIGEGGH